MNYDPNHSILIIGKSDIRGAGIIKNFKKYEDVVDYYGEDSTITKAYYNAKFIGVQTIFTTVFSSYSDFTNIANILSQNDFGYIVPVDIYISQDYNNPYRGNIRTSYLQYLLEQMPYDSNNIFVVTDKHASLYEDMDAFITDMHNKIVKLKDRILKTTNLRNLIYVDNNLKDYDWANVVVASLLAVSDIPDYPAIPEDISLGEPIFTIAPIDVTDEQVYFAEHVDNKVTVENLLNFDTKGTLKPVVVDKIIRYMLRQFNFNEFIGKPYNELRRTRIQNKLRQYLENWKGYVIRKYQIDSVAAKYDNNNPGTVRIVCNYRVQPKNTIEWYRGEITL